MIPLRKLADEFRHQVDVKTLATIDGTEDYQDFEIDLERKVDISKLERELKRFSAKRLASSDDAEMALIVRSELPLTPREAADPHVWWWLCVRRFPGIVHSRWKNNDEFSIERMLGQVNRNGIARLWWGAELVKPCGAPTKYVKMLFKNQDLFEAVIGRSLARYPDALAVILEELSTMNGVKARETVRNFRFLLSTLVLEGMDPDLLRQELRNSIAK